MTTIAGEKRERESETDSKTNESETSVEKKVEDKKETTEKKDETSEEKKDEKKEDKAEKEPEAKKQKIDDKATSSPPKKSIFGSSSTNVSFSSFASYKSPFGSLSTEKNSFSSIGKSTNTNSFESLLSEGKPFDKKKEEKSEEKSSQFKETDTKTGEEDEECIHSVRAKLYEDEKNSWKERGIGLLKINCNKENKSKVRLVMRTEGILRVILNERIIPGMKFNVIQDKYISFAAIDGDKHIKKFLIKTGTAMSANELYQALVKAIPKE